MLLLLKGLNSLPLANERTNEFVREKKREKTKKKKSSRYHNLYRFFSCCCYCCGCCCTHKHTQRNRPSLFPDLRESEQRNQIKLKLNNHKAYGFMRLYALIIVGGMYAILSFNERYVKDNSALAITTTTTTTK